MVLGLSWNDPYGASSNDYDLYLFNHDGSTLLAAGGGAQNGTQDPTEDLAWTNTSGSNVFVDAVIDNYNGLAAPRTFELFVLGNTANNFNTPGSSVLGRIGVVPVAGVRAGVSAADGTWMPEFVSYGLPTGRDVRDYHESTLMADLELARGLFEARGEYAFRRWQTAYTGDLRVRAGYAEARWTHSSGAWLALRGEAMRFSDVATTTAASRPWDDPVDRWEGVVGYRVTHEVRAKAGVQRTVRQPFGAGRERTDLLFAGLGIQF